MKCMINYIFPNNSWLEAKEIGGNPNRACIKINSYEKKRP